MMAPALGIYANLGLISASSGLVAPAVFLAALLCTLPTAVSYALIAREIPSAGSAYTWLSDAVNPWVGTWMGLLLIATYLFCVILQPILFGLFFSDLLSSLLHFQAGYGTWLIGVLLSTGIVASLAYPGIEIAAKSSLVLTIIEAVVVLALSATILFVLMGKGEIHFSPFNPFLSLGGVNGFSRALVFGLLSFVGFGVIATAAEETHSPRELIPRAMILACVFLGLFWAATSWFFSLTLSPQAWRTYVAQGTNPIGLVARTYWGGASVLVIITAITAVLGVYLASVVGYSRVAFAMGRDGALPAFLGRLHPQYRTPWNAQHVAFIATLLIVPVWGRWVGTYLSYDWWGSAVVFFSMVSNIFVSIGCTVFFYRFRRDRANWFLHGLVPLLGILTSLLPLYFAFGPELWRLGWKQGQSVICFSVFIVLGSAGYTAILRRGVKTQFSPERMR
jgi:amino acid transporter